LVLVVAYGYWVHNRWYRALSLLILAGWITTLGGRSYRSLHATVAGLDQIALGMACLLLGLLVSLWKLGVPQAWLEWWLKPHAVPTARSADIRDEGQSDGER
jgi:hypothetical protein